MNELLCKGSALMLFRKFILPVFLITIFSSVAFSQQHSVTGRVLDVNGQPLTRVSVAVKGVSATGALSDESGNFSINATAGQTLILTYVGYERQEVKVGRDGEVGNLTLKSSVGSMNEVVVVGYGTTSRKNLTTAVSKIDPKNVPQAANNSVDELMFGRAAGLQASQVSSQPGGYINLSIRGRAAPLIIVDGVIYPESGLEPGNGTIATELNGVNRGGFAGLSPDDIESIEVLKDASASIYGINAANGVILITTKKGRSGKANISYSGSYSQQYNYKYMQPLNATDYMTYYNQLEQDNYLILNGMAPFGTTPASGYVPKFSASQIQNAGTGTDWLKQVLRNGNIVNQSLTVNGGTDKVTYYLSGNYFNQEGTMKSSGVEKYTGKANISANLAKWVTLNGSLTAARNNFTNSTSGWQTGGSGAQGFGALQSALAYPSYLPVRDSSGKYTLYTGIGPGNPVSLLDIQDKTLYNSLFTNISADFSIIPKVLTGKILFGDNAENATRNFFVPSTTYYFNEYLSRGSLTEAWRENVTEEATLSFKKQYGILNIDAVGGVGQYLYHDYGFTAQGSGMADGLGTTSLGASTGNIAITSYKTDNKLRSYWARSSFNFLDKYILSLTYRYDGFSNFFPQNKYAGFPSASVAWKLSDENFLKNIPAISLLKLRGSYGITGTVAGATNAYGYFAPDPSLIVFDGGNSVNVAYELLALNNPGLTWPKTVNRDIGLDYSLFKDRITGAVDWFKDDFTRLLTQDYSAQLSQLLTHWINGGHQLREGWEFNINTQNIQTSQFNWSSVINVSHVNYRWVERYPGAHIPSYEKTQDPVDAIYAFKTNGLLQIGQTAPAWQPANAKLPGDPIFVDVNGDKQLDSADVQRYNIDPKISIGFGNTFTYKNWDLSIFFYGQFGGKNYNYLYAWANPAGFVAQDQSGIQELKNVWSTSNTKGTLPGVAYNEGALGLLTGSDQGLQSTSFVRCRNITLGYQIKAGQVTKVFKSLRVYVDMQNAFILTKYKIGDPEVQAISVKGGPAPFPMARTLSFGVKANL